MTLKALLTVLAAWFGFWTALIVVGTWLETRRHREPKPPATRPDPRARGVCRRYGHATITEPDGYRRCGRCGTWEGQGAREVTGS